MFDGCGGGTLQACERAVGGVRGTARERPLVVCQLCQVQREMLEQLLSLCLSVSVGQCASALLRGCCALRCSSSVSRHDWLRQTSHAGGLAVSTPSLKLTIMTHHGSSRWKCT